MDGTYSMMATIIVVMCCHLLLWLIVVCPGVVWTMAAGCVVSSVEKGYGGLLTCWWHSLLSNSQPSSFISVVVAAADSVDGSHICDTLSLQCGLVLACLL